MEADFVFEFCFRNGESVLHIAGERGDTTMVELLIGQGADLSLKNNDGNTVLHLLAMQCDTDPDNTIKYLQVNTRNIISILGFGINFPPVNHEINLTKLLYT